MFSLVHFDKSWGKYMLIVHFDYNSPKIESSGNTLLFKI